MNEELERLSLLTMPQALKYRADAHGDHLALREKDFGIWRRTSWRGYFQNARRFAIGLYALGFRNGDRLAVASDDTPEWLYADLAAQMIGGACLGIYPTNPWPELQYILRHSRAKIVVCGDQEQTDKVLDAQRNDGGLPDLTTVICVDMKGMRHYKQDGLMSFADVVALGEQNEAAFGGTIDAALAAGKPDDTAIIVYTSGTTGMPKGAMLSHRNMMHTSVQVIATLSLNAQNYSVLCYLPLCHVAERSFSTIMQLLTGCVVSFAESVDTVVVNLREIAPKGFLGVPRIWEKMQQNVDYRIRDTTPLQRAGVRALHAARPADRGAARRQWRRAGQCARPCGFLALVARLLRQPAAISRHQPCPLRLLRRRHRIARGDVVFLDSRGADLSDLRHDREQRGRVHAAPRRYPRRAAPGVRSMVSAIASPATTSCCCPRPASSRAICSTRKRPSARVVDGWLHTGDIVETEANGEIRIVDRKKDILITSGGKNITPSLIENALKDSPYIREAILLGDGRHFLAALIQIDLETTGKWAQREGIAYTTYRSLAENARVRELVGGEVKRVNDRFARVENVRKFVILAKELDHDDGELTATMKVRRRMIEEKFRDEIVEIYGSAA